jgi:hypothetical protein
MKRLGLVLLVVSVVLAGMAQAGNRIGVLNSGGNVAGFGSAVTIGMDFNETMSGDVGLALAQDAGANNTNIGIVGRFEAKIAKIGGVQTHVGGHLIFASDPAVSGGDSCFTLNGFAGISIPVVKNLEIIADATLLEITSYGGTTTFGLLSGTPWPGNGVGVVSPTIYSGARLYL